MDKERKSFLIVVGNSEEYLLATINELGEVEKGQIFDDVNYYNGAYFIPEENKIFLYRHVIEAFLIE
ncbi:hypothetical protein [Clostridium cavendishii]|uniref:hypothetical protein n=1 Tax=Clostridium cavendishii TaxID=349931 RepID=UPI0009342AD2|nr:hypothetical protein [Clostridium cavendishii]